MNEVKSVEEDLGFPLPEAARALLPAALAEKRKNAAERRKTLLPEGSEPCVTFRSIAIEDGGQP